MCGGTLRIDEKDKGTRKWGKKEDGRDARRAQS
jgi:hypothetical protein